MRALPGDADLPYNGWAAKEKPARMPCAQSADPL
jgi:hypothetical protein